MLPVDESRIRERSISIDTTDTSDEVSLFDAAEAGDLIDFFDVSPSSNLFDIAVHGVDDRKVHMRRKLKDNRRFLFGVVNDILNTDSCKDVEKVTCKLHPKTKRLIFEPICCQLKTAEEREILLSVMKSLHPNICRMQLRCKTRSTFFKGKRLKIKVMYIQGHHIVKHKFSVSI